MQISKKIKRPLGKCHFYREGGLLKIGGSDTFSQIKRGDQKIFVKLKRGDHLYFFKEIKYFVKHSSNSY